MTDRRAGEGHERPSGDELDQELLSTKEKLRLIKHARKRRQLEEGKRISEENNLLHSMERMKMSSMLNTTRLHRKANSLPSDAENTSFLSYGMNDPRYNKGVKVNKTKRIKVKKTAHHRIKKALKNVRILEAFVDEYKPKN